MLFNSLDFLIFFPLVTAGYFILPHRYRWIWLLGASCWFYMAFVPVYILILGGTILIDYFAGRLIEKSEGAKRKRMLILSLVTNIGVLAFFKYYNFLNDNLTAMMGIIGKENPIPYLSILLPIGLSFHTFQAMSYTIEIYRGNQKAERHFGIFALYVMFYPQLVAGPIERPQNMLHQFREVHRFEYRRVVEGLQMMLWGMFKKVVIADRIGLYVNEVYDHPQDYHGFTVLLAIFFFAIQVYCDFSGYSNIALGSARVMGFDLMTNFNLPFSSKSVTEFWRRWHISLSTWFNDYLYTPFVLQRREWGTRAIVIGLLLTFLISGLWHGAAWTFIVFGAMHGIAVVFELLTKKQRKSLSRKMRPVVFNTLAVLITFSFVAATFVFFRAESFSDAITVFRNMIPHRMPLDSIAAPFGYPSAFANRMELLIAFAMILVMYFVQHFEKRMTLNEIAGKMKSPVRWAVYYCFVMVIVLLGSYSDRMEFIYFQF